jgi:uncharacterized alpha-E superfamily protein
VLRADMPRSLHACVDRTTEILDGLSGVSPRECRRLAGEIHARLHFGRIDQIFQQGLHEFLTEFIDANVALGRQIQTDFMMVA